MDERESNPIRKSPPTTESERFVADLCDRTFLGLWSYPCVYQDKGASQTGEGKELCDLLVVFEGHVLIFSDKHCVFPRSGNPDLDWSRWCKRSVIAAAKQLRGAERWIKAYPSRIFVDRACKQRFPIEIPAQETATYHLIVVAHGSVTATRQALGGTGGLVVTNTIEGEDLARKPFTAGELDSSKTFIHIFDDQSLPIVLGSLDTIVDFVEYLAAKETLLRSPIPVLARSEEDLLAVYLANIDATGHRAFALELTQEGIVADEGEWNQLASSGWWQHERDLNDLSYAWDSMIQSSASNTLDDRRWFAYPHDTFGDSELILRMMARESRVRRRTLGRMWLESLAKSKADETYMRCMISSDPNDTQWLFLFVPRLDSMTYQEYRERRAAVLELECHLLKHRHPSASDIIGIAAESGLSHIDRSEDLMYFNARLWSDEDERRAAELHRERREVSSSMIIPAEYNERSPEFLAALIRSLHEGPCPCGSGMNYAQCHAGRPN